jgi:hypothetical protein
MSRTPFVLSTSISPKPTEAEPSKDIDSVNYIPPEIIGS